MKDYSITEDLMDGITTDLETAYDYGYDHGYEDGKKEAWEAAKKIAHNKGLSLQEMRQIFGTASFSSVFIENTASEAIAKIKEYEEQQKQDAEIKVGDEVITEFGYKGIVITDVPCREGNISVWSPTCTHVQMYPVKKLTKTGRHFDQIAEVLDEIRGDSE